MMKNQCSGEQNRSEAVIPFLIYRIETYLYFTNLKL